MMIQTRVLGIVNRTKGAKVHAVRTDYGRAYNGVQVAPCCLQRIIQLTSLDPSESDRLCRHCFKDRPLPWEGTT